MQTVSGNEFAEEYIWTRKTGRNTKTKKLHSENFIVYALNLILAGAMYSGRIV
jgi:hypothetical protein